MKAEAKNIFSTYAVDKPVKIPVINDVYFTYGKSTDVEPKKEAEVKAMVTALNGNEEKKLFTAPGFSENNRYYL